MTKKPPINSKTTSIYISRQFTSIIGHTDLPFESDAEGNVSGVNSGVGTFLLLIRLTVPLAYACLILAFLRELTQFHPSVFTLVGCYLPTTLSTYLLQSRSGRPLYAQALELWMIVEVLFELGQRYRFRRVASISPIECALSAAPLMEPSERSALFWKIMTQLDMEQDLTKWLLGWFFDLDGVENLTKYDVLDYLTWALFEARHKEHLTYEERDQLKEFLEEIEWRLSHQMYGEELVLMDDDDDDDYDEEEEGQFTFSSCNILEWNADPNKRTKPRKEFHFSSGEKLNDSFLNIYEALKKKYNLNQVVPADQQRKSTYAVAHSAYNNVANRVSVMGGEGLAAHLFSTQEETLHEIWNLCAHKHERLELVKKLEGFRAVLADMRSKGNQHSQMPVILKKITKCEEALMELEQEALTDFYVAIEGEENETKSLHVRGGHQHYKPQRYYKYSHDPLLGLTAHYPLAYHLSFFSLTDGMLRLLLGRMGFARKKIASTVYYFHPGEMDTEEDNTPIVWVHGIGVGNIYYLGLIEALLKLKRPLFLPEIPYVCGFRPWLSRNSVLTPNEVTSTLTGMLASRGFLKATFVGHSYGTTWLSYMCKYANHAVASVLFLDPICFLLYYPGVARAFVYHRRDPGSTSYLVMSDFIINYTIQRNLPWQKINIFLDDIPEHIPVRIYLSHKDFIVPSETVEKYLKNSGLTSADVREDGAGDLTVGEGSNAKEIMRGFYVFRGGEHGGWCTDSSALNHIADTAKIITDEYERKKD